MAYDPPTPAQFKTRFPEFNSVDDAVIQSTIDEAARWVDESWTEGDFAFARMLYTAHTLIVEGKGDSKEAKIAGLTLAGLTSVKISSLAVGFKNGGDGSSKLEVLTSLTKTSYGQRFLTLLRVNKPAVIVADGIPGYL